MEDRKLWRPDLTCNQDFAKRRGKISKSGNVLSIGVARIFDWGGAKPQITCSDVIRNFQKKELFVGQRYRKMKDLKP